MAQKIRLFTFAEFAGAPAGSKIAIASHFNDGSTYDVSRDFYKQLRDFIPRNHRDGGTKADLRAFPKTTSYKKTSSYKDRVQAYLAWWGDQNIRWVGGRSVVWAAGGVQVNVNPELFVSVDGVRHVVKLNFSDSERFTVDRVDTILRLLEVCYRDGASPNGRPVVGLLDLPRGDFHMPVRSLALLDPVLAGEAATFASILEAL